MPQVESCCYLTYAALRGGSSLTVAALLAVATTAFAAEARHGGDDAGHARPRRSPTKQIQKALGIKADGVMGPKTRRAHQALPAGRTASRPTASPARPRSQALGLARPDAEQPLDSAAAASDADVATSWPRSPSASPAATRPPSPPSGAVPRQVPVLAGDLGVPGRHRRPRRGRRGRAGRVPPSSTSSAASRPGRPAPRRISSA